MGFLDWWVGHSRLWHNAIIMTLLDGIVILFALFNVPGARGFLGTLSATIPNILELVIVQLIAALSGHDPASTIAGGWLLRYGLLIFTMYCIHLVIAIGIGFLFDHTERNWLWRCINYGVLLFIIAVFHIVLALNSVNFL